MSTSMTLWQEKFEFRLMIAYSTAMCLMMKVKGAGGKPVLKIVCAK